MDIASLSIKVFEQGLTSANANLKTLQTNARGAAQGVDQVTASSSKMSTTTSTLGGAIGGLTRTLGIATVLFAGLEIVKTTERMNQFEGRIRNATDSLAEADYALAGLFETAKNTGSLDSAIEIFQRLSFTRKEIKATTDEMLQFVDTVQKLGIVSGASPDAMKFGLTQLGQSLSSNIVRAEEFNSIMENIPAVGKQIADQFGVTTGQLRNLVIEGKVLSADVFAAILNSQSEVEAKFENMAKGPTRAFLEIIIMIQQQFENFDNATNSMEILYVIITKIGEAFSAVLNVANGFLETLGAIGTAVTGGLLAGFYQDDPAMAKGIGQATSDATAQQFGRAGTHFKAGTEDALGIIGVQFEDSSKKTESSTRAISQNYADIAKSLGNTNKEAEKHAKTVAKTISDLEFRNEQMGRSLKDQEIYNNLRQANVEIDSVAGQKIQELSEEYLRLSEAQKLNKQIADDLGSSFSTFFKDATDDAKSLKDTFRNLVDDIQDMFFDLAVSAPLKKLIAGIFDSSGSGGGGGIGGILGSLGGIFGGSSSSGGGGFLSGIGSLFGFADGGSFQVGGTGGTDSQLVAFRASPDETVSISRPQDNAGGGGGSVVYNIDARGAQAGVEQDIMRALMSLDKSIEKRAINAVGNTMKRDPTFGSRG